MKRRRSLRRGRRGEVAVFDIVLFVPLLLVALLLLDAMLATPVSSVNENVNSSRYASEGLATTLGSTVNTANSWEWWYPCHYYFCSPCPNPGAGCWTEYQAQDMSISDMVLWDAYFVSCNIIGWNGAGYVTVTQAQLDTPGWIGAAIASTSESVAQGIVPGTPNPVAFTAYYFEFNGTASSTGAGCNPPAVPMSAHDGQYLPVPSNIQVYTWSTLLPRDHAGRGPVLVNMAFWDP